MTHKRTASYRERQSAQLAALDALDRLRAPLLEKVARLARDPETYRGQDRHACCTREHNQMRISPLEAQAIARAFREDPQLRRKLPAVLERLEAELPRLRDTDERQSFDCPLLEGTRCLVHHHAKPVGCAAWHPPGPQAAASTFSRQGWQAFRKRDILNDRLYGPEWKLRVIPLWLKRVFVGERKARRPPASRPAR